MLAFDHDKKTSYIHADRAMREIAKRGLPILPEVYGVFYAIAAGSPSFVKTSLAGMEENGKAASLADICEIGRKLLAVEDNGSERLAGQFEAILKRIASKLDTSAGKALEAAVASLGAEVAASTVSDNVRRSIAGIVSSTKIVVERDREIATDVHQSVADVKKLRDELEAVRKERDAAKAEARTDGLTGAANRLAYGEHMKHLFRKSAPRGKPLSLIAFDVDRFKSINDQYGHQFGDDILIELLKRAKAVVRESGTVFRVGGEEFMVVLDGVPLLQAKQIAEKVRHAVNSRLMPEDVNESGKIKVTVSLGVAERMFNDTPELLYRRADRNLYAAKQDGRDKVVAI